MLRELVLLAVQNILKRRLRSFLTLLGIIIGVAAVVSIISLTTGIQQTITSQLTKFMSDIITVSPGRLSFATATLQAGRAVELTDRDLKEISKIDGVELVNGLIGSNARVEFGGETGVLYVYGIQDVEAWKKIEASSIGLEDGRYLTKEDKYSAIIGNSVAHKIFSKEVEPKKTIRINGIDFKVEGILNKAGGVLSMFDSRIYIPEKAAREIFSEQFKEDEYSSITVKVEKGYDVEDVADTINERLLRLHHQTEETKTFTVLTSKFFQTLVSNIISSLTTFLTAIASVSLLVGGIGIMNIMYVSVTERTREIGVMKAIGATNRTILLLFLLEAGIFGLFGGIFGDAFGIGVGYIINYIANMLRFQNTQQIGMEGIATQFVIEPQTLVVGAVFGFLVGVMAGYFPARKASKLQPVEALRYE